MSYFKLKKEARQFFDKDKAKSVLTIEGWKLKGIPVQLLDSCERVRIEAGISKTTSFGTKWTDVACWSNSDENKGRSEIHFTVVVEDCNYREYQQMDIPELMDNMQEMLNQHFDGTHGSH